MQALKLTSDGTIEQLELTDSEDGLLDALQAAVGGGNIEMISLDDSHDLVINEDGKFLALEYNSAAMAVLGHFERPLFPGDFIVGDALVVGVSNGETVSVDEALLEYLPTLAPSRE